MPDEPPRRCLPAATPPPPQSTAAQPGAPKARLDFSKARVKGLQPMQTTPQATRLPVIDKPDPAKFFCVHPIFGGFAYPVYLWRRKNSGKSAGNTMRLVSDEMAVKIADNGGDVIVGGLYWARYSKGGDFILVANLESDNDYITTSRSHLREGARRSGSSGSTWAAITKASLPTFRSPTRSGKTRNGRTLSRSASKRSSTTRNTLTTSSWFTPAPTSEGTGLSAMGERMAKVERAAQSMGVVKSSS